MKRAPFQNLRPRCEAWRDSIWHRTQ